jgi:uncharacterized protein (TIGR01777 family)
MRVLVSGSSGLIGSALIPLLRQEGHAVGRLVRTGGVLQPGDVAWSPVPGDRGTIDRSALEGVEAIVHLAGESIFGRWISRKKRRIAESRVAGTTLLARALAGLARKPRVLVSASGAHFYGDRGVESLTEESAAGRGFLAETCQAWEAATRPAADAGIRVVRLRSGVVLSPAGGVLRVLLLPFRLGLGGPIGRGRAYWSWIGLPDLIRAIRFALEHNELAGPVNTATPNPVTNAEFSRTLARVLRRPAWFPVPPAGLRLVFGREAANELMLSSTRLVPQRLQASGFRFDYPELEPALRAVLR